MLYLETPNDRGCPWTLRFGDETARLSCATAMRLQEYGVPVDQGTVKGKPIDLAALNVKMSKKALALLRKATGVS